MSVCMYAGMYVCVHGELYACIHVSAVVCGEAAQCLPHANEVLAVCSRGKLSDLEAWPFCGREIITAVKMCLQSVEEASNALRKRNIAAWTKPAQVVGKAGL